MPNLRVPHEQSVWIHENVTNFVREMDVIFLIWGIKHSVVVYIYLFIDSVCVESRASVHISEASSSWKINYYIILCPSLCPFFFCRQEILSLPMF